MIVKERFDRLDLCCYLILSGPCQRHSEASAGREDGEGGGGAGCGGTSYPADSGTSTSRGVCSGGQSSHSRTCCLAIRPPSSPRTPRRSPTCPGSSRAPSATGRPTGGVRPELDTREWSKEGSMYKPRLCHASLTREYKDTRGSLVWGTTDWDVPHFSVFHSTYWPLDRPLGTTDNTNSHLPSPPHHLSPV